MCENHLSPCSCRTNYAQCTHTPLSYNASSSAAPSVLKALTKDSRRALAAAPPSALEGLANDSRRASAAAAPLSLEALTNHSTAVSTMVNYAEIKSNQKIGVRTACSH